MTLNGQTMTRTLSQDRRITRKLIGPACLMDHVWDNSVDSFQQLHPGPHLRTAQKASRCILRAVLGYDPIRNRIGEGYLMGGGEV